MHEIILTLLCHYIFMVHLLLQAKNLAISLGGRVSLTAYLSCLTFNRLTTYISIFSITQPLQFDNGRQEQIGQSVTLVVEVGNI